MKRRTSSGVCSLLEFLVGAPGHRRYDGIHPSGAVLALTTCTTPRKGWPPCLTRSSLRALGGWNQHGGSSATLCRLARRGSRSRSDHRPDESKDVE